MIRPGRQSLVVAGIALLFLLGLFPALRSPAIYHGDERFYTDAALSMQTSGDYSLPRYADGAPRRNKPLLAYWVIAASHRILGKGLWQARLPFALAGAGLVLLTGIMGARLAEDPRAGILAALVMASHPDLLLLSIRSTPDVLVCVAVLLALDGMLRNPAESALGAWEVWIGAGLAAAAKGLWGLLVLLFVLAFTAFGVRASVRSLARAPAMLVGCSLAALAIVPLFAAGAGAAAEEAASDQLRAAHGLSDVLHNAREYLPAPLIHFLPWTLLLGAGLLFRAGRVAARAVAARPSSRTALCWWGLLVFVFLFGAQRRVRYLAPAHAPLAILLAALLLAMAGAPSAGGTLRRACVFLSGLCATLLFAGSLLLFPDSSLGGAILVALGVTCLAATLLARRIPPAAALQCAGWSCACVAIAFQGRVRPCLFRSPLPAIVARIGSSGSQPTKIGLVGLDESLGSRLRLLSGGRLVPEPLESAGAYAGELVLAHATLAESWTRLGLHELARFDPAGGPSRSELLGRLLGESPRHAEVDPLEQIVLLSR